MLIQFLHYKDTNQKTVKALSRQLQQFYNVTDYRINVGWIHSLTRSEQGYNIRSIKGTERYYLHTGKEQANLKVGDLIFFNYTASTYCEDRLDIIAQCSLEELFDSKQLELITSFLDFFNIVYSYTVKADIYTKQLHNVSNLLLKQQYDDAVYQNIFENQDLVGTLFLDYDALCNSYINAYLLKAENELEKNLLIKLLKKNVDMPEQLDVLLQYSDQKGFSKISFAIKIVAGHALDVGEITALQLENQYKFLNAYISKHPFWREIVFAHPETFYNDDIANNFIQELPQDKNQWYTTLLQFPLNIQNDLANKLAEQSFEYVYKLISEEQRYIEYILACIYQNDFSLFDEFDSYAQEHKFHHVKCMLDIIYYKASNRALSVYELNKIIENYTKNLFITHSENEVLSKIDYTIFANCKYEQQAFRYTNSNAYKPKLLKQSFCEGKEWYKKEQIEYVLIDGDKRSVKELDSSLDIAVLEKVQEENSIRKVMCRRHDCNVCDSDVLNESILYQLLHQSNFSPSILHAKGRDNNQILRRIASINRWNTILDRLQCKTCDSPFMVSEHSQNSMGKMAYSATYWHCSNLKCHEYTHVVKITHCISCMDVIDSRGSKYSCTPYEPLSFRKFYFCTNCASCCSNHGFKGTCPHCGLEDAYINITKDKRTKAECRGCKKTVSIEKFAFDKFLQKKAQPVSIDKFEVQNIIIEQKDGVKKLYVYDLYDALSSNKMKFNRLKNFDFIIDVKILYKMAFLGLDHKQYKNILPEDQIPINIDQNNVDMATLEKLKEIADKALIRPYFHQLYKSIELPFTLALYQYAQSGLYLPKSRIKIFAEHIAQMRNAINFKVQNEVGVFPSDKSEVTRYLEDKYHYQILLEANCEKDFDGLIKRNKEDVVVQQLQLFDKLKRAGSVIAEFSRLESEIVKPEYQIVGTVTGRCTAKKPAILSFPKVFRSIFACMPGHQLYSFDYGQIELGILAGLSQDEQLISDYNESDIYQELADETDLTRDNAKIFFLGLLYGITDQNLIKMMSVSASEILQIRQRLIVRYPNIEELRQRCIAFGQQHGFINNIFGLHRAAVFSKNKSQCTQNWEKNWFFNFPIQSTAAAVFKKALIHIFESDTKKTMKMVCPLYDEFLVQIPHEDNTYYIALIRTAMITALRDAFPQLHPKVDLQVYDHEAVDEFNTNSWLLWFEQFRE